MSQICIQIPPLQVQQTIGLEVTVNGKRRLMEYRVESCDWSAPTTEERIGRLRRFIEANQQNWELVQIGSPDGDLVPVMFRRRAASNPPGHS